MRAFQALVNGRPNDKLVLCHQIQINRCLDELHVLGKVFDQNLYTRDEHIENMQREQGYRNRLQELLA